MPENMVNGFNINGTPVPYNYDSLGNKLEKTSIAREYSNIDTYDVDEYVIYNGRMYRCKQKILVGESFDSTKWTECSIGPELNYIKKFMTLSDEAKQALLNCFSHVAWIDEHGQDYYDELEATLFQTAEIISISAVFNQGSAVIYDTDDLDTLKQYLTVTATYEDLSTREITAYTLSGTLTAGTSTITVSYGGKTATFDATVSQRYSYSLSSGLLTKIQGVLSGGSELGGYISESTTHLNTRRTFLLKSVNNRPTLYKSSDTGSTFTPSEYYPVPVPTGATQVTVAITPNTQFFNIVEFYYDSTHPIGYVKFAETGWKQGSFTRELTEGTTFVGVSSKYNSAGTSYPTEPTELTIVFS